MVDILPFSQQNLQGLTGTNGHDLVYRQGFQGQGDGKGRRIRLEFHTGARTAAAQMVKMRKLRNQRIWQSYEFFILLEERDTRYPYRFFKQG